MNDIETFLRNNATYAENFRLADLAAAPRKQLVIVTCMDARLETLAALGLEVGDAHVLRNAGGVVTDDVLRSLVISQRLLGTRQILVIHHTACGMMQFKDEELRDQIEADTGARPSFPMESFDDLEADVRKSMRRIRDCPFLQHKNVTGLIHEVETGRLREVLAE